jgi:type IV pilus assembly protein PilA
MKKLHGFTLMEMMVVLAIICILAMFALPIPQDNVSRKQIVESVELIEGYKKQIAFFYQNNLKFPVDNAEAEIPKANQLIGNFVTRIELKDGAFHLYLGNKIHTSLKDKILSVRPITVKDSPASPISWICGYSATPEGMIAVGDNLTNVDRKFLPLGCR